MSGVDGVRRAEMTSCLWVDGRSGLNEAHRKWQLRTNTLREAAGSERLPPVIWGLYLAPAALSHRVRAERGSRGGAAEERGI